MEKQETKVLLEILSVAYPNHYRNMATEQMAQTLSLYYEMFGEYPTPVVVYALKAYIKANPYPPTIAGLQNQIDLLNPKEHSAAELWVMLEQAIRCSAYAYAEEFAKLPVSVQSWLGDPVTLHKLSQQDSGTTQGVTRGQFLKSIDGITQRQKAFSKLPENMRALLMDTSKRLSLE